jgi:membrane associated rhomboid family serine protease
MAFRSNRPISLVFPPFRGVTRRIILVALCAYFGLALLALFSRELAGTLTTMMVLRPDQALHPLVWELATYAFVGSGLLSMAFALLSIWFFGSTLEDERGSLWMSEFFLTSIIGGAFVASLISAVAQRYVYGFGRGFWTSGLWPGVLAIVVAYGWIHAEDQVQFNFIFTLKAKYLAAVYVLFYVGLALVGGDRFGATVALCNAGVGFGFLLLAPRRGFRMGVAEKWLRIRNSYHKAKRRRAAKKFTVYMRKQGKEVSLDKDGHYIDPEGNTRDLNDRRWMN